MRLFAAVEPSPEAVAHLDAVVAGVRDGTLRWSDPAGWHLTLAFYGQVAEERLHELTERLERAARRHPPTRARIAGAGRFGTAVLWAGVDGDRVALRALAGSVRAAGRRTGVGHEDTQPFRPHVTLARSRGAADLRPYVERLAGYAGPEWAADAVTLLRSHPGGAGRGPRYEPLATFPLRATR